MDTQQTKYPRTSVHFLYRVMYILQSVHLHIMFNMTHGMDYMSLYNTEEWGARICLCVLQNYTTSVCRIHLI